MNEQDKKLLNSILAGNISDNDIQYLKNKYSSEAILKEASSTSGLIIKYFGLTFFLNGLEEMNRSGKDILKLKNSIFTPHIIDVNDATEIARKNLSSKGIPIYLKGIDIFELSQQDRELVCNNYNLDRVELNVSDVYQLLYNKTKSTLPITIVCRDISELSIEFLNQLKDNFNIKDIRFRAPNLEAEQRYHYNIDEMIDCRRALEEVILSEVRIPKVKQKKTRDAIVSAQVMYQIAKNVEYDEEALKDVKGLKHNIASNLLALVNCENKDDKEMKKRKGICGGYAEIARNALACCGIEAILISGFPYEGGEGHVWNEVKLGDDWYNADLTQGREKVQNGLETAELFCNDEAFYCSSGVFYIKNPNTGNVVSSCISHKKYNISKCEKHDCNSSTLIDMSNFYRPYKEIPVLQNIPTMSISEYLADKQKLIQEIREEQKEMKELQTKYHEIEKANLEGRNINE